ncbi:hypothetical protein HMPREF0860_0947 [Treponema socranskii subsp. socranskii VPI DR56BR1116 = ATCC 35536]|uniref:Uncharacterized protein n=1 Tax=Treponema socranskii subsp. socranskii VPI DR56BR1116 = ATCC 35536 TaxID=1125725 RepID=U2L2B0_TRESO|nr:hypothetical protein HMPREF1325_1454 [Treponema socranskii subsp. socranskii VPI DR56BR1116 = ATCC 35536]ERK04882.1 hypothetical protein HMPREF0860_0947 [Treponema socranskii subsp. socranskii VPI DR56BR1116 = ATCC 35536]
MRILQTREFYNASRNFAANVFTYLAQLLLFQCAYSLL